MTAANLLVLWALASVAAAGRIDLGQVVIYAQCAVGTSLIAFGGLNWALDGSAAPVAAVMRLESNMATAGALADGANPASGMPRHSVTFKDVTFAYPAGDGTPVLMDFNVTIPAGSCPITSPFSMPGTILP